jgi:cell division inhibitor SulA/protein ImuA
MSLHDLLARPDIWRGDAHGAIAQPVVSSGFTPLDAALPGGGWPLGVLTEVLPAHEGIGELRLLGPALASIARSGRMIAWIAPPHLPYAPALAAAGIDLARIVIVKTRTPQETLWATEQALAANACGAVLAWPATKPAPRFPELRRLQLAVEGGRGIAAIFRPPEAARESSPAVLRIALETAAGALAVRILKRRGAPLAQPIVLDELAAAAAAPHVAPARAPANLQTLHPQPAPPSTQAREVPFAIEGSSGRRSNALEKTSCSGDRSSTLEKTSSLSQGESRDGGAASVHPEAADSSPSTFERIA